MASYDVIVIGSGDAGLTAALALARHRRTLLLTKDALEESATRYAQGGIAAALGPGDAAAAHCADTIAAGAGLVDEGAARVLAEAAAERIAALVALGVPFDREGAALALGREAAHSAARIVHAGGDATGLHLERTLAAHVRQAPLAVREHAFVTSIVVEDGCVAGVKVLGADGGGEEQIDAPIVVLATGGAGQLYRYTTNPTVATGDGIALASRAGAALMDLEFIQFHPPVPSWPRATSLPARSGRRWRARMPSVSTLICDRSRRSDCARAFPACSPWRGRTASTRCASRSPWRRRRITQWAACAPTSGAKQRYLASMPAAKSRAPACTARTGWRATRSSKGWSSARVRPNAS